MDVIYPPYDDRPYNDDDDYNNNGGSHFKKFLPALIMFGLSILMLFIGMGVQSSLGSWLKKIEVEKLRLERERLEELEKEASHSMMVPTDRLRLGRGLKNIDPIYCFLWLSLLFALIATSVTHHESSNLSTSYGRLH